MSRNNQLFEKVMRISFVEPLARWQLLLLKNQTLVLATLTIAVVLLSTVNVYSPMAIALAIIAYGTFVTVSRFFSRSNYVHRIFSNLPIKPDLLRGIVGLGLVILGLRLLPNARESFWLLLLVPLWRIIRFDPHPPNTTIFGFLLAVYGIFVQDYFAGDGTSILWDADPYIKTIWLFIITTILAIHVEIERRQEESEITHVRLEKQLSSQMFQVNSIERWGEVVLEELLKLTKSTHGTFQVSNYLTGYLDMVSVVQKKRKDFITIPPSEIDPGIRFSDRKSEGVTAYVVRSGKAVSLIDVSVPNDLFTYVPFFPNIRSEIAAPIYDNITKRIGGVINIEYSNDEIRRPKTEFEMFSYRATVEEFAAQLSISFSNVLLSDLRNKIRLIAKSLSQPKDEEGLVFELIQGLYSIYQCPIGVWTRGKIKYEEDDLVLTGARGYPEAFGVRSHQLRFDKSLMGEFLSKNRRPKQILKLSATTVDYWNELKKMEHSPRSMIILPLFRTLGDVPLGAIQLFSFQSVVLSDIELDLLNDLANQFSSALDNLRSSYEERRLMLGNYATAAAHDIGSSINQIGVLTSELIQATQRKTTESNVEKIEQSLQTELDYLEDVRDMVGAQVSGQDFAKHKRYLVSDLIQLAVSQIARDQPVNSDLIKIVYIPPRVQEVYCFRPVVVGAIRNIVKNAFEIGLKDRAIEVEVERAKRKKTVFITIFNYGPSILREFRKFVFEPGMSTKGGLGIGLGTYRELLREMGNNLVLLKTDMDRTAFRIILNNQLDGVKNDIDKN